MASERSKEAVARLLGEAAQSDALGTLLTVLPLIIRALLGERLEVLDAEIGPHVTHCVAFFLAGRRSDGIAV
jgi:hypothetical protein